MSVDVPGDASHPRESSADGRSDDPPDDRTPLASVVVRHEGTPDRRTLYPTEATEEERLTNWISADDAVFVRLDTVR